MAVWRRVNLKADSETELEACSKEEMKMLPGSNPFFCREFVSWSRKSNLILGSSGAGTAGVFAIGGVFESGNNA